MQVLLERDGGDAPVQGPHGEGEGAQGGGLRVQVFQRRQHGGHHVGGPSKAH